MLTYEQLQAGSPAWMSKEAILTLKRGYLDTNETPIGMYKRLARTASSYYESQGTDFVQPLQEAFELAFLNGWLSPSSPVASNLGTNKGLPVSCFGINVQNSIKSITDGIQEGALLSKNGGGLGVNLSNLIGSSQVITWAKGYDWMASSVSQGGVRRGAVALYLDIEHPDIEGFLDAKDILQGDPREKLDCNIAVIIRNTFLAKLEAQDPSALNLFSRVLELRMKFGSPYLMFLDNARDADPEWYKALGLSTQHTQLCAEIMLHSDAEHTYSCVLASLNAALYLDWKSYRFENGMELPELAIYFLDAVNEEFIEKASKKYGFEKAVRGAIKGRPLGLGVLGLHSLYQSQMVPFESTEAFQYNWDLFEYMRTNTVKASKDLASMLGECEWARGYGRRNTHLIAIAPTTTNSVLCNAGSPGIEPVSANYYAMAGAKGTFVRKNKYLVPIVKEQFADPELIWSEIRKANGSIQNILGFTQLQKDVFKTAFEIPQWAIVRQAAERQQFIDQGQSLNLFFYEDSKAEEIVSTHLLAAKLGLKSLYYVRSTSKMQNASLQNRTNYVFLKTREDCGYCQKAKELLAKLAIPFEVEHKATGKVPEVWLNGEQLEDGYNSLARALAAKGEVISDTTACNSCEG